MNFRSGFRSGTSIFSRNAIPLSDEQIMVVAPSIFAEDKHDSRSERYTHIPTGAVLAQLRKAGFMPFMAAQTRVREEDKRGHAKHMLRLRHVDHMNIREANEVILVNSHDGTSSYQMYSGIWRQVCSNGLVRFDAENEIRVRHSGKIIDNVIDAAFTVVEDFEKVNQERDGMKGIQLSHAEQLLFAKSALELKYDMSADAVTPPPVEPQSMLRIKRAEDRADDLWTVFNRTQEHLINGGVPARTATGQRTTTRQVTGLDQNVKLNKALWTLAEGMKALKS